MATRKHSTSREPRPCTIDLDGFPGASVYRLDAETYYPMYLGVIVGEVAYKSQAQAEGPAIAAWVRAHPACQVTADTEADELALEQRAVELDEQAELDAREAELAQRCPCFHFGEEQAACLASGKCKGWAPYPQPVEPTKAELWRDGQERIRAAAAERGLLVPDASEPVHPDPAMSLETYAAVWDARSAALDQVAEALGPSLASERVATAHVSLERRLELRRGRHSYLAVEIFEDAQGYASSYIRSFDDEGEGRAWVSAEAARLAGASRAATA